MRTMMSYQTMTAALLDSAFFLYFFVKVLLPTCFLLVISLDWGRAFDETSFAMSSVIKLCEISTCSVFSRRWNGWRGGRVMTVSTMSKNYSAKPLADWCGSGERNLLRWGTEGRWGERRFRVSMQFLTGLIWLLTVKLCPCCSSFVVNIVRNKV